MRALVVQVKQDKQRICPVGHEEKPTRAKRGESTTKRHQTNHQTKNTQQTTPHGQNRTSQHRRADATQQRRCRGESKRRPANKEGADAREGSRDRRKRAQAKKTGTCSFIGVLSVFWITRGRIPQCQSEGHMNSTHHMVERAKHHTGPKPLLP